MKQLDFQIILTDNYYVDPNSIHLSFLMKIKKQSNEASDKDTDLITVNNFFAHLIKEIGITRYRNDKQLIPTFSSSEIYQYCDCILKHLLKNSLKNRKNSKKPIYFNKTLIDRRINNGSGERKG